MSPATKKAIDRMFGGDKADATDAAQRLVNTHTRPPEWAQELAAPRTGWKQPAGNYMH